jgi:hypothetical protein
MTSISSSDTNLQRLKGGRLMFHESDRIWKETVLAFFLICIVGGGIKVHSTLRPLNGLLCQPRVIMIMKKSMD